MKIAQIAPLYEAVPPRLYGGTERIVAHLTDALVELGHEVTLFASAEARTSATLVPVRDQAIRLDPCALKSDLAAHLSMLHELHKRRDEFDVLHFHVDLIHFPFFEELAAQTVTTLHGRLDLKDLPEAYARWRDYPAGLDLRRPARTLARGELAGHRPAWAGGDASTPSRPRPGSPATWPSSAGSRRRSARTGRSPSPSARACR